MSNLELNKVAAGVLIAALIAMIVGVVANVLYKPKLSANRGYHIEVAEGASVDVNAPIEEEKPDIEALMSKADIEAGKQLMKKCVSCHSYDSGGPHKVGPNIFGIVGAKMAHHNDFKYSKALLAKGENWTRENLFAFLHKPAKFLPGTKMSFVGFKKFEDIANIIAYLEANK